MGSGRDKRKKKKGAAAPGAGAEKTAAKTAKKADRRAAAATAAADTDLDALINAFKLQDAAADVVGPAETAGAMPPRVYAGVAAVALTAPGGALRGDAVLFHGGERFDVDGRRETMHTFGDVWLFRPRDGDWRRVATAGGPAAAPPPRSGHQAVAVGGHVYVFGGEVTSRDMEKFRHYNDLWRLDLTSWAWERLPSKAGPAARSGHRCAAHKNRLFLFGGFTDDGKRVTYHNDVWSYSVADLAWTQLRPAGGGPAPRGGGGVFVLDDCLYVVGGHTAAPDDDGGGGGGSDKVWDDVWCLKGLASPASSAWTKIPRAGFAPAPRASFGLALHRRRAILWGGVVDAAGRGDKLYSEHYDDIYQFRADAAKWFPVVLRPTAAAARAAAPGDAAAPAPPSLLPSGAPVTPALHAAATRIQARYRGHAVRRAVATLRVGGGAGGGITELLYSPALIGADAAAAARDAPRPRSRAAPALVAVGDALYLFGGLVEVAHADVTLDDVWRLPLKSLAGWECVRANTQGDAADGDDGEWGTDSEGE